MSSPWGKSKIKTFQRDADHLTFADDPGAAVRPSRTVDEYADDECRPVIQVDDLDRLGEDGDTVENVQMI